MKRAAEKKAKLAEEGVAPKNVTDLTPAQQKQIEQAEERRTAAEQAEPAEAQQQD
jgi:hypothetical protein